MFVLGCRNSDGLSQFTWSHDGYWQTSKAIGIGKTGTSFECAEACLKDDDCVAMNYYSVSQYCFHYTDVNSADIRQQSDGKAYIRCPGISV